jgi:hypothetical protein
MSTTNALEKEIGALRERIESLELDIALLKAIRVQDSLPQPYVPYQPWVSPAVPPAYWTPPVVTYCIKD